MASTNSEAYSLVPNTCAASNDWRSLIEARDIDGVIIATPPDSHAEITKAAFENDLAVMVEKPLTLSLSKAEEILISAEAHQAVALVDHTHLFHPAFVELKKRVQQAKAIQSIHSRAGQMGPFRRHTPVLWDWAPHDIAMCLSLTGQMPSQIWAKRLSSQTHPEGKCERYQISLTFDGNISVIIEVGNNYTEKIRSFTVYTDERDYTYDDCAENKLTSKSHNSQEQPQVATLLNTLPLTNAVNEFAERIRQNDTNTDSLRLGVDVVRVLTQCDDAIGS